MIHTRKQIEDPKIPMILSNSGIKIATQTNTALTPTLTRKRPNSLVKFLNILSPSTIVSSEKIPSKVDMMGLAFNGVFARGTIQMSPLING